MQNKLDKHFKIVLSGIWSPFFRKRIKREISDHLDDLAKEKNLELTDAVNHLGDPEEANSLYKKLMYQKLKSDFLFFGSISAMIFTLGVFAIHEQVNKYTRLRLSSYSRIEKKYKQDIESLNHFARTSETRNAQVI